MVDIGHRKTDEVLERLEKRLAEEYDQAYKDVEKKAADYFKRFEVKDKQKKALVDAGKLPEKDYQTWRRNQMLSGKRWTDLRDQLAKDLTNVNQIAAGIVRGELNEVFAINANYSEYMIENGMRTNYGFTLYDRNTIANLVANDPDIIPWKPEVDIPADLRWNRQMITSHITQGILQGESIPNLSKRLLKTVNNDKVAAVRTARTAVTSSQNAGRQMVYDRAKRMGLKLKKSWVATLDARTRHEHGAVDGQEVPLDGQFTVGGYKMKFPGDMSAPPHLIWNCRCTTITVEPDYITKGEEPRMTYSEWVESKEGKEAIQKKKDAEKKARKAKKAKQGEENKKKKEKEPEKPKFAPASTIKEAEEYAKKFGIDANYSKYDISVANAINKTMQEYTNIFGQHAFDSLNTITSFAKGEKSHEWGGYSSKDKSIKIRGVNSKDAIEKFGKTMQKYVKGYFSTDSNLHIIRHELGHAVHDVVEGSVLSEIRNYYRGVALDASKAVSIRSGEDFGGGYYEFIAECLAQYMNGNPSKIAIDVVGIIKKGFERKFGVKLK